MFTIEKTKDGWFRVLKNGHIEAVVPDETAAKKAISLLQLKKYNG